MNNTEKITIENPAIGGDALEFIDTLLTPEEIAESDLRVALIGELIKARRLPLFLSKINRLIRNPLRFALLT